MAARGGELPHSHHQTDFVPASTASSEEATPEENKKTLGVSVHPPQQSPGGRRLSAGHTPWSPVEEASVSAVWKRDERRELLPSWCALAGFWLKIGVERLRLRRVDLTQTVAFNVTVYSQPLAPPPHTWASFNATNGGFIDGDAGCCEEALLGYKTGMGDDGDPP